VAEQSRPARCARVARAGPTPSGHGKANAKVMIIGEAPGRDEDKTGPPFVVPPAAIWNSRAEGTGIERSRSFITNIVNAQPLGSTMILSLVVRDRDQYRLDLPSMSAADLVCERPPFDDVW